MMFYKYHGCRRGNEFIERMEKGRLTIAIFQIKGEGDLDYVGGNSIKGK